ncbi:MAG: PhnA domain-containing protein [Fibrobacterales bacterium]
MAGPRDILLDSFLPSLQERAEQKCELCFSETDLAIYEVPPVVDPQIDRCVLLCKTCSSQLSGSDLDTTHFLCLNESAWSQVPAVQVVVWRLLKKLTTESWAQDLLDQIYLEEEVQKWAEDSGEEVAGNVVDANGGALSEGDTVTVIKDLNVKGTSFVAKRGTVVKSIHLGRDPELVEGKVNGVVIFLKTCFLKKS